MEPSKRPWTSYLLTALLCIFCGLASFSKGVRAEGLSKVKGLHQTKSSASSFEIAWEKDVHAKAYELQYSMDGKNWSSGTYHYTMSASKYPLNSGQSYYVRVRGFSSCYPLTWAPMPGAAFSDWSSTLEAVTAPGPVTHLQQTAGSSGSITVEWKASEGANCYAVYYVAGGSQFRAGETSKTSYTVSGLHAGTRYSIRVYPMRRSGSGYTAIGDYVSHDCFTAAPKATGLSYRSWDTTKKTVSLEWDGISSYLVSGYEVSLTNLAGRKAETIQALTSSAKLQLSSSKSQGFLFKVRAFKNVDGVPIFGDWSNTKAIVPQPKVTLKRKGNRSIQLSWVKIKGASSYTIYKSTSSGGTFKKFKTVKATSYTDVKLNKKTCYYYVVANGVKVNGKSRKSTKASKREIAYLDARGKTRYYFY